VRGAGHETSWATAALERKANSPWSAPNAGTGNYTRLFKLWKGAMAGFDTDENALPHSKLTRSLAGMVGVAPIRTGTCWSLMATPTRSSSIFFTRSTRTAEIACTIRVRSSEDRWQGRMIVEIRHYSLIFALAVALVQSVLPLAGAARRHYGGWQSGDRRRWRSSC
jgi:hypothetical protein